MSQATPRRGGEPGAATSDRRGALSDLVRSPSPHPVAVSVLLGLVAALVLPILHGGGGRPSTAPPGNVPTSMPLAGMAPSPGIEAPVATFSIVARDPDTGDLGVAVQSKFLAVGAVVPYARAGVGAVATQAFANVEYGPRGLALLSIGKTAREVVDELTGADEEAARRQLGVVDAGGRSASFTGAECLDWAGEAVGEGYAIQGNILAGPEVVDAMAAAYETADGDLATRMVAALEAGQAAGGDARGRQSAALLVVREGGGYAGSDDRFIDLRVDDHAAPIRELRRLLDLRHAQLAAGAARRALGRARELEEEAPRREALQEAVREAERSVDLDPGAEWSWVLLAAGRLRLGDRHGAAAAGRRALLENPWLKTALLRDTWFGPRGIVEELLEEESFRRLWEAIPADVQ